MTSLKDFNSVSDVSSNSSNISKHADNSLNALFTSYSTESSNQTVINDTAAVITEVNVTTA